MSLKSVISLYKFKKRHIIYVIPVIAAAAYVIISVPFGSYDFMPAKAEVNSQGYSYGVPLDSSSPWPKFRANELQNGRSRVIPKIDASAKPWTYQTQKGIFSSPVVDKDGTVYVGSADQKFYAIRKNGQIKWILNTGEIIDSSALLDNSGHVYFGSGDQHIYCADRETGKVLWKFKAHSVEEVQKEFGIKTYNVAWFEGNISMLKDGTILAPNDNYLVYAVKREDGKRVNQFFGNEMIWSAPAVNTNTGRIFFGTTFMAQKNIYCYDSASGKQLWTTGGLGTVAATILLTNNNTNGALIVGGFDGFVRAIAQDSGKQLWKFGTRDHIYASAAQLSDGTIIQPSADGTVYALDPKSGKVKWAFDTLEPIRSSPAVDGNDTIYVGSGEGRLFCINPDGTLRWAYRCITDDRNDLNASPALGNEGVYVAGESGGIFYIPYDYPLSAAGKKDPLCTLGPKEDLPENGTFMIYTTRFGALEMKTPEVIDANEPLTFSLFVRNADDTVLSAIDRDSIKVNVTGSPKMMVAVSANRRFISLVPQETWTAPAGGTITVNVKGTWTAKLSRFGMKFFGGSKGGDIDQSYTFKVAPRSTGRMPYKIPVKSGDPSASFEFARLAAPLPTMLPSWNQIGFDSLHYLAGAVEGKGNRALFWVIGGKLENGVTVIDPTLEVRYPVMLDYDGGLVTFSNYEGFKINFVGSWDMPFGLYRHASKADPVTGKILTRAAFNGVALCDDIEFYGKGLKLMGMSEFDTGKMAIYGGMNLSQREGGSVNAPAGIGSASFSAGETSASVDIKGGTLKKGEHVYSLVLVNDATGMPFPLYYTKKTVVEANDKGIVTKVTISYNKDEVKGKIRGYYMVDTYPASRADLQR